MIAHVNELFGKYYGTVVVIIGNPGDIDKDYKDSSHYETEDDYKTAVNICNAINAYTP